MFGAGAAGFFAVPYTVIVYPIVFLFAARLWSVCPVHGYVTPADFVRGRFGSRGLALAVAVTGILATMPYIALQLVGIQAVLTVHGRRDERLERLRQGPAAADRVPAARRVHLPVRACGRRR